MAGACPPACCDAAPSSRMNPDTQWLIRLGIDQGLFTRVECVRVKARLGTNFSMVDFAQKLIDEEIVTDVDTLERIQREHADAVAKAKREAEEAAAALPIGCDPPPVELPPEPAPVVAPEPVKVGTGARRQQAVR